ncbi:MAG: class I SAM-dependent methyltransferase [Dehalococcoidia bacterium]
MVASAVAGSALRQGESVTPYEHLSAAERYIHQTRDAAWLDLLRERGFGDLSEQRIVEIGCAEGSLLRTLLHHGATPGRLTGIDIDPQRLRRAPRSAGRVAMSDGAALPYRDGVFDLAFAFTFLSSVIDPEVRRRAAAEALRVLRHSGLLLVYDFWTNPVNSRVRPLGKRELASLFAPHAIEIRSVTLAPPIVRALGGRQALCAPFERLSFLRTHLLAAVSKE